MANFKNFAYFFFIRYFLCFSVGFFSTFANHNRKEYIVYMGSKSDEYSLSRVDHLHILHQLITHSTPNELLIRSYGKSFNGFSAKLTDKESENLKSLKGVVSVFPSRTLEIQTTRSWDFLGLPEPTLQQQTAESNTIVGVFDTGIWPESPSFDDHGLGPIPSKWKGVCNGGQSFKCNKKLIGARTYGLGDDDARDNAGHGSHCASIAAGSKVDNTSFYGIANGSARGGASFSRIAVYKVCHTTQCSESDILAAFDDAIADGVDVVSISIGGGPVTMFQDVVAIGSFHAMEKGILTVQAGGNFGTQYGIIGSVAPWILSVAASTMDRRIVTKLVLGNGTIITGTSVNSFTMEKDKYPLVHATIYGQPNPGENAEFKGKIVVTEISKFANLFLSYGAAGVVSFSKTNDVSLAVAGPVVMLTKHDFDALMAYLHDFKNAEGTILKSETTNDTSAPVVVSFSSRGPNQIASDILKPDITAPGVDILAAWSPVATVTEYSADKRRVMYNILSGTSMSCPHVAGAASYLKSQHPDWSPSAIKSALMTSSQAMSRSKNPEGEFAYGAGHLNPVASSNPGLVYETTHEDYLSFLCKLNYTKDQLNLIVRNQTFTCPKQSVEKLTPTDVNYPTMIIKLSNSDASKPFSVDFHRTVTNVGNAKSTYTSKVESLEGRINVRVEPKNLSFNMIKEQKSFTVNVVGQGLSSGVLYSASLVWTDGIHSVRSPILVYT